MPAGRASGLILKHKLVASRALAHVFVLFQLLRDGLQRLFRHRIVSVSITELGIRSGNFSAL
jgi:hypothetical protein